MLHLDGICSTREMFKLMLRKQTPYGRYHEITKSLPKNILMVIIQLFCKIDYFFIKGVCKYFGSGSSESGFAGFKDFQDGRTKRRARESHPYAMLISVFPKI